MASDNDLARGGWVVGKGSAMDKFISAAEPNREFFTRLREVREGCQYVVTGHGRPIARLVPVNKDDHVAMNGHTVLLSRLKG